MRTQLFVMCLSVIVALGSVSSTAAATASGSGAGLITGVGFSVTNYQPVNGGAVLSADVEDL